MVPKNNLLFIIWRSLPPYPKNFTPLLTHGMSKCRTILQYFTSSLSLLDDYMTCWLLKLSFFADTKLLIICLQYQKDCSQSFIQNAQT